MRRVVLLVFVVFLMFGCKSKIPKEIIQPDKMEGILYDMHVVDGYVSTILEPDSAKKVASSYYKGIYKKFGIDSAQYKRSLDYYYMHSEPLNDIYDRLSKKFNKQKELMEKAETARQAKLEAARLKKIKKADGTAKKGKVKPKADVQPVPTEVK